MKNCETCGGGPLAFAVLHEYRDAKIGIDRVVLKEAVWAHQCPACGHLSEVVVPNLPGLVAAVAIARVKLPVKLNGKDIRFLRRALDLTGKGLAEKLEVAAETVSRWENDHDPIGPAYEKLLRLLVGAHLALMAPMIPFDARQIDNMHISSVHSADEMVEMCFYAVPSEEPENDKRGRLWVRAATAA